MIPSFEGARELIDMLDGCVAHADASTTTDRMQKQLSELILDGRIETPEELRRPVQGHYARRLLYKSPEHGYVVVGMTWGPGQGTPLHDHAGTWCVEGVLQGRIEVCRYDLRERRRHLCRFERMETMSTGIGASGALIPPYEYHTIANHQENDSSVTLHIYGYDMRQCTVFEPQEEENWYLEKSKPLGYDN